MPGSELADIKQLPDAYVLQFSLNGHYRVIDIPLKQEKGKLIGKVKTDSAANFLAFGFLIAENVDTNEGNGYLVHLHNETSVVQNSYLNKAFFYTDGLAGDLLGIANSYEKAIAGYEKEYELYPSSKKDVYHLESYFLFRKRVNKESAVVLIQKEIEQAIKAGLKDKVDYMMVESLYDIAELPQQSAFIATIRREKYPSTENNNYETEPYYFSDKFSESGTIAEKLVVLKQIVAIADTAQNRERYNSTINNLKQKLLQLYIDANDFSNFRLIACTVTDKEMLAESFQNAAEKLFETGVNLKFADSISLAATMYAKKEWLKPTIAKPDFLTARQWEQRRKERYAMYANTYAKILYKMGAYKKGFAYAKESAIRLSDGNSLDYNNTYFLLAEKIYNSKQYTAELEKFVKKGKASDEAIQMLKKEFVKMQNTGNDFDEYLYGLKNEAYAKTLAELKTQILNKTAPQFSLSDLNGNNINLADYKGKVVVLDFWATWCGSCIALFPGMMKLQQQYKNDNDIQFFYVNTLERGSADAVKAFLLKRKYQALDVLMDSEDKVVKSYGVFGIPTKIVIGKDGKIKFKSVGWEEEEVLLRRLSAMIELSK
ncbi:hypothetical protein GCM10027516_08170 [Niabella aquatica]